MGLGMLVVFWLIFYIVLSLVLGILSLLMAWIFSKKQRKLKMFLSFFTPALVIGVFSGTVVVSTTIASYFTGNDIGFGDAWYTNLSDNYQLMSIDLPENGCIKDKNGENDLSGVTMVELVNNDTVIGKTYDSFFLLDMKRDSVAVFTRYAELKAHVKPHKVNLVTNNEFYGKKRIFTDVIALIAAFMLTTIVTTLFWRIPLKLIKVFLSKFRSPAKTL